jgi:hypothetical protein
MTARVDFIGQAESEYAEAHKTLRDALVRIQSHRVDSRLGADVPDVSEEITYLMKAGKHRLVPKILDLLHRYVEASVHRAYVMEHQQAYTEVVERETDTPDYLK